MVRFMNNYNKLFIFAFIISFLCILCCGVSLIRFDEDDDDYYQIERLRAEKLRDMLNYLEKSYNLRAFLRQTRNLAIGRGDGFRPGR
uniref:Neuropeptide-Like Protein n=1 Tax=Strongyloides stercoralis TaxID=6248 RepID=A0A0K0E6X8_STRER